VLLYLAVQLYGAICVLTVQFAVYYCIFVIMLLICCHKPWSDCNSKSACYWMLAVAHSRLYLYAHFVLKVIVISLLFKPIETGST